MKLRKFVATTILLVWIIGIGFLAGPARWELAHTYAHLIGSVRDALPSITIHMALPILGLATPSSLALPVQVLTWGWLSGGPLILLVSVWRQASSSGVTDWLLYGGLVYWSVAFVITSVFLVGLLVPFALL